MSEQKKVTTTDTCKIQYTHDEDCKKTLRKCIKVPEVVGRNSSQVLIESVIPFPDLFPAVEIKDIKKEVKDLRVHVCKNKVLINGVLHKNINYKTFEGEVKCGKLDTFFGDVKHVGVDIPFATYIDVPGAKPGDKYQIEFAGVEDECEVDILEDPVTLVKCTVKAYRKLREKVIVKVDLKVLREVQIAVYPDKCNICP
ncbi:DUF3794 domain-containing protein [Herbivorax sp. ANBcel31]|uniref:DUF3794 domain-containing protein n=1 Tax=Herbivorax sp. ANBcel31 TaxID=3069754 RepID=UPI0027B7D416|nr:DUF3794 domain-containing protein [Herbivorax sp. ANBcel31]MDQ2085856.1 DUF3794 domain-containing protein [Herbivorax sp. ANBcel31]